MAWEPRIFRLDDTSQESFAENDEIFSNVQLGIIGNSTRAKFVLVIDGLVAVVVAQGIQENLNHFYSETWARYKAGQGDIISLYNAWLGNLNVLRDVRYFAASRSTIQYFAATGTLPPNPIPPPPPTRPTVVPGGARPPGTSSVYGHLPFQDITGSFDIYYRFEAWPTSRRIKTGAGGTIGIGTFASPSSELPFIPTGFAAVSRNALPSFFPAVFRYELAPVPNAPILCGAVVPMFGMSGGGVEVMFTQDPTTPNRGAIALPAIIPPL